MGAGGLFLEWTACEHPELHYGRVGIASRRMSPERVEERMRAHRDVGVCCWVRSRRTGEGVRDLRRRPDTVEEADQSVGQGTLGRPANGGLQYLSRTSSSVSLPQDGSGLHFIGTLSGDFVSWSHHHPAPAHVTTPGKHWTHVRVVHGVIVRVDEAQ